MSNLSLTQIDYIFSKSKIDKIYFNFHFKNTFDIKDINVSISNYNFEKREYDFICYDDKLKKEIIEICDKILDQNKIVYKNYTKIEEDILNINVNELDFVPVENKKLDKMFFSGLYENSRIIYSLNTTVFGASQINLNNVKEIINLNLDHILNSKTIPTVNLRIIDVEKIFNNFDISKSKNRINLLFDLKFNEFLLKFNETWK